MYNIVDIDYEKALEIAPKYGIKIMILYLFDQESANNYVINESIKGEIADELELYNRHLGEKIAFLTHYVNKDCYRNIDEIKEPKDAFLKECRSNKIEYRNKEENENMGAYQTMKKVAKSFGKGTENDLPCFVIFNPQNPTYFVRKSAKKNDSVYDSVYELIREIEKVKYDMCKYALKYSESYYIMSNSDVLKQNLESAKKGIPADRFLDLIKNKKAEESFNIDKIKELSKKTGHISLKASGLFPGAV